MAIEKTRHKKPVSKTTACIVGLILFAVCVILPIVTLPYWTISLLDQTNELGNLKEIPSPNGSLIVDYFNVYGGATSANFTQVYIRRQNERFDWRNGCCLFSIEGIKKNRIKWISDSQLEIQHEPGVVYRTYIEWNGLHVIYSELK